MMQYQANSVGLIVVAARQSENEDRIAFRFPSVNEVLPVRLSFTYATDRAVRFQFVFGFGLQGIGLLGDRF